MIPDHLGHWVTFAIGVVYLVVALAWLLARDSSSDGGGSSDREGSADGVESPVSDDRTIEDGVRCRECGAINEPEYRYCRDCTVELSGANSLRSPSSGASGRGA
jgi:ribosomal protein L40E